jgi:hypothetical protein
MMGDPVITHTGLKLTNFGATHFHRLNRSRLEARWRRIRPVKAAPVVEKKKPDRLPIFIHPLLDVIILRVAFCSQYACGGPEGSSGCTIPGVVILYFSSTLLFKYPICSRTLLF